MKQKTGVREFLHELETTQYAQMNLEGCELQAHLFDEASKFSLSTPIYLGSYIPPSVKQWLSKKPPFESPHFKTSIKLDMDREQILLYYLGKCEDEHLPKELSHLLKEFAILALKWRQFLDWHDKNDLIYVKK